MSLQDSFAAMKQALQDELLKQQKAMVQQNVAANLGAGMGNLQKVVMPVIRRIMPSLIAQDIIGVQPMTGRLIPRAFSPSNRSKLARRWRHRQQIIIYKGADMFGKYPKKGRKGKPHWRENRICFADPQYRTFIDSLRAAYHKAALESTEREAEEWPFFRDWAHAELQQLGGRIVFDMFFQCDAIQVDDDATRIAIILKYSGE